MGCSSWICEHWKIRNDVCATFWVGGCGFRLVCVWFEWVQNVVLWLGPFVMTFRVTPATLRASVFLCTTVPERAVQHALCVNPLLVVQWCAGFPWLTLIPRRTPSPPRIHSPIARSLTKRSANHQTTQ